MLVTSFLAGLLLTGRADALGDRTGTTLDRAVSPNNVGSNPQGTNLQNTNPQGTNPQGTTPQGTKPQGLHPQSCSKCNILSPVQGIGGLGDMLNVRSQAPSSPFDAREATIESVHHALYSGLSSCREIVSVFLARIEAHNNRTNAIISLHPDSLRVADRMDQTLAVGNATGSLFCIPVLLKDNYDTATLPTTAGCLAMKDSQPSEDAPSVKALKNEGAIILGKANMHELALEGISVSSLGGQTINPYDSTRTPGGSSGGSGAAVAASLCVFATGTDTVNSLRSPASANSLFSIRPTRGLITRRGIVPISTTQDAIGPIGRTIKDIAIALTAMCKTGYDAVDNATALVPSANRNIDYSALPYVPLTGLRLGILKGFFSQSSSPDSSAENLDFEVTSVNDVMDTWMARLEAQGATLIPINEAIYDATTILSQYDVQRFEYRELMDAYLQQPSLGGKQPRSLAKLYSLKASNTTQGEFLVLPSQHEYVNTALVSSTANATYRSRRSGIHNLTLALQTTFATHALDAIIYPEQKNLVVKLGAPSQYGRNGILAAVTGSPVVTVPVGFSKNSTDAPIGVPIGMEILGRPWEEQKLLGIGYSMEMMGKVRRTPVWARERVEVPHYEKVPEVRPNLNAWDASAYLGTL